MRITILAFALLVASVGNAAAVVPGQRCETGVASAVGSCVARVNKLVRHCYAKTGAACAADDASVAHALASLTRAVETRCVDDASAEAAGYGAVVTRAALLDRVREACLGEAATIAARTFGGPHAALLDGAQPDVRACLDSAFGESGNLLVSSYRAQSSCIRRAHTGGFCNTGVTALTIASLRRKAVAKVAEKCPTLSTLLALTPTDYLTRATTQAECLTATAHGDSGPLDLACGPRPSVPVPARGQWVKVTLDSATWGTSCGDGSPYAFWLRLAPSGSPAWRVVTDMQGGGVCLGANDCGNTSPGLFKADEGQPGGGYLSTNPAVNPFYDWTMLFMPYCTQDLHIGGGGTSTFPTFSVQRFGALNARAALRYLRDVVWGELEASDPDGWHPDRLRVMFSGESAGGYGVMYNYHYPLDELRWVNTTAMPDSGLALGSTLPLLVTVFGPENQWNILPMLPPYCTAGTCGSGPVIENATVPRLEGTPWQQMLNISNQVDTTQSSTTSFPNVVSWTNALRTDYCDERGQTGIHFFLPASSTASHTMLRTDSLFTALAAQGVTPRDYTFAAMANPAAVVDRVDEGTLVVDRPGVNPIPCALPPP